MCYFHKYILQLLDQNMCWQLNHTEHKIQVHLIKIDHLFDYINSILYYTEDFDYIMRKFRYLFSKFDNLFSKRNCQLFVCNFFRNSKLKCSIKNNKFNYFLKFRYNLQHIIKFNQLSIN